jgi:hypothetical protein
MLGPAIAKRKGRGDTPGEGEFDLRAQCSKVCSHNGPWRKKGVSLFSLFVRHNKILPKLLALVNAGHSP